MRWNRWVRQAHRWLSILFTLTVVANFAVRAQGEPPDWVTYSPLLPLALLLFTGLYLFVLPYVARRRGGRPAPGRPEAPGPLSPDGTIEGREGDAERDRIRA